MSKGSQKLILVTTTRADWGILSPLARALSQHPDVELTIAAANMHLSALYGHTIDEIRADGFDAVEIGACEVDDTAASRSKLTASITCDMADIIERLKPDGIILLGDRYEMLGVATAAVIASVPIVHLHGGEISEGAIDDAVRHALTKMASLHLVATEKSAERIIRMGEEPRRVVRTGALGVENALTIKPLSIDELRQSLDGFHIDPKKTLLVTFHPVTRHPLALSTHRQIDALLEALDNVPECNVIFTYPNNDTGSNEIIERIEQFATQRPDRVKAIASLGKQRYLSALWHVLAVVGNTSSGLLEAPSTTAVTIDIGPRQQGRERAETVIHVDDDAEQITRAIRQTIHQSQLLPNKGLSCNTNPYYKPEACRTAVEAITRLLPTLPPVKKFYSPHNEI